MELTENQFSAVEAKIDDLMRGSKAGTPERVAAQALCDEWEKAIALPEATWQQRKDRRLAIAVTAARHGLINGEELARSYILQATYGLPRELAPIKTREDAARQGALDGAKAVETFLAKEGAENVLLIWWYGGPCPAGKHILAGVPREDEPLQDAYYTAYAGAAQARVREIAAELAVPWEG